MTEQAKKTAKAGKHAKLGSVARVMNPIARQIAQRLKSAREARQMTQAQFADFVGITRRGYQDIEGKANMPSGHFLQHIASRTDINLYWLLTGEGPERVVAMAAEPAAVGEGRAGYASHDLSEEHLTIALELADRAIGDGWLPGPRYSRLVKLLYEGVSQGLPIADVLQIAHRAAKKLAQGESIDGSESEMGEGSRSRTG